MILRKFEVKLAACALKAKFSKDKLSKLKISNLIWYHYQTCDVIANNSPRLCRSVSLEISECASVHFSSLHGKC